MKNTKKKIVWAMEEEETTPDYEGYAFLLFHTVVPSYAFVDDLNKLYGLALTRTDDIKVRGLLWPMFLHYDPRLQLQYYLIERPAESSSALWTAGHKLLIVRGEQAAQQVKEVHNEFSTTPEPADPTDLLTAEHNNLLAAFQASFTLTTPVDPTLPPSTTQSRKAQKEQNDLTALIDEILDFIDIHQL